MSLEYTYLATNGTAKQVLAPTTETASFNSGNVSTAGMKSDAVVLVNVGALGGTSPTLSVQLQASGDGGTTWANVGAAIAPTAAGTYPIAFQPQAYGPLIRIAATLGGTTPSIPMAADLLGWTA